MIAMMCPIFMTACLLSVQAADSQYDTYMKSYGGGSQGGSQSQSGNYQQYMNGGGSQGGSQSQSGNYQQYMKKYAGGQGGDYQQYMKKYAGGQGGDYQQYMKKYGGGGSQSGGSQSGDYQQYMKKYAGGQGGDYQQYMKKYAGGQGGGAGSSTQLIEKAPSNSSDTLNLDASATGSQGGNYQQYMDKYAGSYEKYFQKYTKSAGGSGSQSGDYQQYMKKYAGGSQGGSQSGDYQQYMKKYAGGQGGDYQQYMKKYAGGSQGGSQSGVDTSSTELIEQPPTKDSDSLNLASTAAASQGNQGNYQKYMDKYAGSYEKYMKQYAGNYQKYQNYQQYKDCESSGKIRSAKDANTTAQLDEWYKTQQKQVKCFVPDDYSKYAASDMHKEYKKRLAELNKADKASQTPLMAEDTAEELIEKPEESQSAGQGFLAKRNKATSEVLAGVEGPVTEKSETVQSQAITNLASLADQVKSDPAIVAGAAVVSGAAVACFVFFAVRYRRSVQLPLAQLG